MRGGNLGFCSEVVAILACCPGAAWAAWAAVGVWGCGVCWCYWRGACGGGLGFKKREPLTFFAVVSPVLGEGG